MLGTYEHLKAAISQRHVDKSVLVGNMLYSSLEKAVSSSYGTLNWSLSFKQHDNRDSNWCYYKDSAHSVFVLYGKTDAMGIPCIAFFILDYLFYSICMSVLPTCMSAHHLCAWGPRRPKHPIRSPGTGVEEGYVSACGHWEPNFERSVSAVNCRATYPGPVTYSLPNTMPLLRDKIGKHPLCLCLTCRPYCQVTVSLLPLSDELQTLYMWRKPKSLILYLTRGITTL